MKKLKILTIAVCLMGITLLGYSAADTDAGDSYTVTQAQEVARANSLDLKMTEADIDKAKIQVREAKSAKSDAEDVDVFYSVPLETQLMTKLAADGYYLRIAEMALVLAEQGKIATENMVDFSVKNAYYDALYYKEKYAVDQKNLERSKKQYDIAKTRFELGVATKQELLNSEAQLLSDELEVKNALSDLYYAKTSFNNVIGMPQEAWFDLMDGFSYEAYGQNIELEELFAEAKENRFTVDVKKEAYETAQKKFDVTKKIYSRDTYKGAQAYFEVEKAYADLIKAENEAELSVRKAYVDMVKAYRSIESLDKSVEALSEAYRLTLLSYEVGMATVVDVMNAQSALSELELAKLQVVKGYNLAKMNFEFSYGVGLPY